VFIHSLAPVVVNVNRVHRPAPGIGQAVRSKYSRFRGLRPQDYGGGEWFKIDRKGHVAARLQRQLAINLRAEIGMSLVDKF
jgi:hypothetical protein